MQLIYAMINSDKVVKIINASGGRTTYIDEYGEKYNEKNIRYIWKKGVPIENPKYVMKKKLYEGEEEEDIYSNYLY